MYIKNNSNNKYGHPQAQADLSYEFIRGTYFPKNYEIAKYWMQKGLDQGEPEAELMYGDALYHGTVFPMDKEKGLWHIKKAAADGNEIAIKALEKLGIELILCPNCGNPIKETDKFCGKCGCKLQASGEV